MTALTAQVATLVTDIDDVHIDFTRALRRC